MNITKATIKHFIEAVEGKALKSIADKYQSEVDEEKNRILESSGIEGQLKAMQRKLAEVEKMNNDLIKLTSDTEEILTTHNGWNSIGNKINIDLKYAFHNQYKYSSKKLTLLEKDYLEKKDNVKNEYAKVMASIQRMSSVNKMINYLKDIGFDVTSIQKEQTAITTNVDTKYLFVCGDNK